MRGFFAVIFGLLFLVSLSLLVLSASLNQTLLNPDYLKNLATKTDFYQQLPTVTVDMFQSSEENTETNDEFIGFVEENITADKLETHFESIVDQTFDTSKNEAIEDISWINDKALETFGVEDLADLEDMAEIESVFPSEIKFDKTDANNVINSNQIIIYFSVACSLLFLILVFFISSSKNKARLLWLGWFGSIASLGLLFSSLFLFLANPNWVSNFAYDQEQLSEPIMDFLFKIINQIRSDLLTQYLYAFGIVLIITIVLFIIASRIKLVPDSNKSDNNKEEKK